MKDKKQLLIYAALAATALISLLPFFKVGFTCSDDFQYFITAQHPEIWVGDAMVYARDAGRFYFLITKFFYYIPYLIDNFAYTKAVQYISLLASYVVLSWFVYRLFKSKNLSLLVMLLLIFDTTITRNNHVPTIAYPFYFSFSLILFIGAILIYLNYKEKGGYWRILLSSALFLVTYLFYETYLIFAILFGIVIVIQHWKTNGFTLMLRNRDFWREVLPYIGSAAIYLGCYFGYRQWILHINPDKSFYDGAAFSFASFSISGFFKVLGRCTRFALPGQCFFESHGLMANNSQLIGGHRRGINMILAHAPAIVWVNALIQAGLVWFLTRDKESLPSDNKKITIGIVVSLIIGFFAHTLIGIAKKYNTEWCHWMHGYVTSYYAIFALMLVLALLIALLLNNIKNSKWRNTARIILCTAILIFAILIGYTNQHISREWAKTQNRLNLIDLIAKSDYFSKLPENTIICSDELHTISWTAESISHGHEIEDYIDLRAKRRYKYVKSDALEQVPDSLPSYYIHAVETTKACELLISFSKLNKSYDSDLPYAVESDIFYYSPAKQYTVFYQSDGKWKHISYKAESEKQRLTHISITDTAINPRTIVISDMILPE